MSDKKDNDNKQGPIAIISDVHGNLEALLAVLADIKKRGINRIYGLGDFIGYGPDPDKVIDLLLSLDEQLEVAMAGNHDCGIIFKGGESWFALHARYPVYWARKKLFPVIKQPTWLTKITSKLTKKKLPNNALGNSSWKDQKICDELVKHNHYYRFLTNLKRETVLVDDLALAHANPFDSTGMDDGDEFYHGYIISDTDFTEYLNYMIRTEKFDNTQLCFVGHSHKPRVRVAHRKAFNNSWRDIIDPTELSSCFDSIEHKHGFSGNKITLARDKNLVGIVNVGSVGQPRDYDPRACYVVYDCDDDYHYIECLRINYYMDYTASKLALLDDEYDGYGHFLGNRLASGH